MLCKLWPSNCSDGGTSSLSSLFIWPLGRRPCLTIRSGVHISLVFCRWLWLGDVTQHADSEAVVPGGGVHRIELDTEYVRWCSPRQISRFLFWAARRSGQTGRLRGRWGLSRLDGAARCTFHFCCCMLVRRLCSIESAPRSGLQAIPEQSVTLDLTRAFGPLYSSRGACSSGCVPSRFTQDPGCVTGRR